MKRGIVLLWLGIAYLSLTGSIQPLFRMSRATPIEFAELKFEELILDPAPLANDRINDLQIGDLDGDGWPDIWLSGRNADRPTEHQAAWYRNPGETSGAWQRLEILPGSWKYGALGDLDGDGDLDLASDNDDDWDGKVYWLENDGSPGDGGWTKHDLGLGGAPDLFVVADLNRDGVNEVVIYTKNSPPIILRRPASPTRPWIQTTLPISPRNGKILAGGSAGDVDADGDLDLIFGNRWYENPGAAWTQGDAWTERVITADWPGEARSLVGDVNGDGKPDILLTGEESSRGVAWFSKDNPQSPGDWTRHTITASYSKVHSIQLADFNLDGRPDVFAAEMHTSLQKRVSIFVQTSAGGWVEQVISRTGSHNARVGDLDLDGLPDIAGKNFEQDIRPRIWLNRSRPTGLVAWKKVVIETNLPWNPVFVDAGDVDGDGQPDLVAGGWWYANPGSAGGDWAARRRSIGGQFRNMAVLDDLDGDRDLDLLGTDGQPDGGRLLLARNHGAGVFTVEPVAASRGDFLQGAVTAQLIPGGPVEVVLSWHNGARSSPPVGTEWLQNSPDPAHPWRLGQLSPVTNEEQVSAGDIDQDGDLDLHLGASWLRHDPAGYTAQAGVTLSNGEVDRVQMADLDEDGDLDVILTAEHTARANPSFLAWGENTGVSWIEHEIPTSGGFELLSLDVGDIDQDGDLDLAVGEHQGNGRVWVYENLGRGRAWRERPVDDGDSAIDHHNGTQLKDVDGDGDLDILSIGWQPGKRSLVIYENTSAGPGAPQVYLPNAVLLADMGVEMPAK